MSYVVFDLDGCLADDSGRRSLLPNFAAYHSDMLSDPVINLDKFVAAAEEVGAVVFLTARPTEYRDETTQWIATNLFQKTGLKGINWVLLMRPHDNTQPSPGLKLDMLSRANILPEQVVMCYDDREDVVWALRRAGYRAEILDNRDSRDTIFDAKFAELAALFKERNAKYHSNYKQVDEVLKALHGYDKPWPAPRLVGDFEVWHLYELLIVKLTRFANSGLQHKDSIEDLMVYAVMIAAIMEAREK